jgi:2-iminoacetate synthase
VSLEVYPMKTDEYRHMSRCGIDGLTLYQETYNRETYSEVHPAGKKKDFLWRLTGPDRGGKAGFRKIGIAPLLGLADWRIEGFFTALHALYLSKTYWKSHIQISFPRLRTAPGGFHPPVEISDHALTHLICAMRIILPDAGLVLSTREPEYIRDNVMSLGITMMSAGSRTEPGGYTHPGQADNQFSIEDRRSPEEMCQAIRGHGLDPVWKDWDRDFIS